MIPQIVCLIFAPIMGKVLTAFKRLSIWFIISSMIMTAGIIYFMLAPSCDGCYVILPGFVLFSLGQSIYTPTIWLIPSLLVKHKIAATGLGLLTAMSNLGFLIVCLIGGVILDNTKSYFLFILFDVLIMLIVFILFIVAAVYDYYHGLILHKSDTKMSTIQ